MPRSVARQAAVRHRIGTVCCVDSVPRGSRIHFPGNVVHCPAGVAPALVFIAENPRFVVRQFPDVLDDRSKLTMVKKLVTAGLLVPV